MTINGVDYVEGVCRNDPETTVSHLYRGTFSDPGEPMCARGWNRNGGFGYSIFRGNTGGVGTCRVCLRRARAGLASVPPRARKTKWI